VKDGSEFCVNEVKTGQGSFSFYRHYRNPIKVLLRFADVRRNKRPKGN